MNKHLLQWLEQLGRKRIVMDRFDNEPYLERYYLLLKDRQKFPFNIFLHQFLKSDPDDVHDHPWPYATLIIKGGYYEWVPQFNDQREKINEVRHWRGVGHFRLRRATSYHRIELDPAVECWTLFMPGPRRKDWGFLVNNQWIQHEHYLAERSQRLNKIS